MRFIQPSPYICISVSKIRNAGRGVFATKDFVPEEVIEKCPVLPIPANERELLQQTEIVNYYFLWGRNRKQAALALGFGSIYNHSLNPNARYRKRISVNRIDFIARREIKSGEEITVNYNGDPADNTPLKYAWAQYRRSSPNLRTRF